MAVARRVQSLLKGLAYRCGFSLRRLRTVRREARAKPGTEHAGPLRPLLHRSDPYAGFAWQDYPSDPSGWGSESPAFDELIAELRPRRIIEVGTWKGGSAIHMGQCLRKHGIAGEIVCVDTWLGALEMWTDLEDPERHGALRLRHGYPTLYYQFLANVCHAGLQDCLTPLPLPSVTAAQWFALRGVRADLIYLDGSHEEDDVYQDLCDYWELARPGAVVFGDDWSWDGVRMAVERFCAEQRLAVSQRHDKWELRRPR